MQILLMAILALAFSSLGTNARSSHVQTDSMYVEYHLTSDRELILVTRRETAEKVNSELLHLAIEDIDLNYTSWVVVIRGTNLVTREEDMVKLQFGGKKITSCPSGWESRGSMKYSFYRLESLHCDGIPVVSVDISGIHAGSWQIFPVEE